MMIQEMPGFTTGVSNVSEYGIHDQDMGSSIHLLWDLQPVVSFFISNMGIIRVPTS